MSNTFGSSDISGDASNSDISPTSVDESNTQQAAGEQLNPNGILIFCMHALLSVLFAYIWGFLATNALFLSTESKDNLDYILPVDEYKLPYTKDSESKCWYTYGFPYNLGVGRSIGGGEEKFTDEGKIIKRQKDTTYFLWLSKEGKQDPKIQVGFFPALTQDLFEATYGGLGKVGRTLIRVLLSILSIKDKVLENDKGTWYGDDMMQHRTGLKIAAFLIWPFVMMNMIIPVIGIWSGITTFIFGILQTHIVWGLIFSFTIGMMLAFGNGIYMAVQAIYVFFIYPWSNSNSDTKTKFKDIFQSLIPYMLIIFYFQICLYGYSDLGPSGGAGIMFIVLVSIVLQLMKHSS